MTTNNTNNQFTPNVMKVKSSANPKALAAAIYSALAEDATRQIILLAIGPAAVNQAVKGIAVARNYLIPMAMDISAMPAFTKVDVDGEQRNAMQITLETKMFSPTGMPGMFNNFEDIE